MLTEKSTERNSQPQMKKKGTALLAGFFLYLGSLNQSRISDSPIYQARPNLVTHFEHQCGVNYRGKSIHFVSEPHKLYCSACQSECRFENGPYPRERIVRIRERIIYGLFVCLYIVSAHAGTGIEPFSKISTERRDTLTKRLNAYVEAYRGRKWEKLYELVSSVGRGGVNQNAFVAAMKSEHGTDFAQMPDLLEFRPELIETDDKGEFDIYGCGKARREGMMFNGIAITHAVLEHNEWFFTDWRFTEFPNEPCKALSDPKWEHPAPMEWSKPMDEVKNFKSKGVPFHVDAPQ